MPGRAVQILDITENSFHLNVQNFNSVLNKVGTRPFVLYSINGAARTGKSYTLNFFIRYLEANFQGSTTDWIKTNLGSQFEWKSGKQRTTVGISLWSEPYILRRRDQEIAVLLMDTQGLFDEQTTARQHSVIFAVSSLCASVCVVNLMKNMDENFLQQLQLFSEYANLAQRSSNKETTSSETFQKLMFLIRDFEFPEYSYGHHNAITGPLNSESNYYRDIFVRSEKHCASENQDTRERILRCYKDIGIFILPDPGSKFLRDSMQVPEEDFLFQLKAFVEMMLSTDHLILKRIRGQIVSGIEFKKYVEAWAGLCDKDDKLFPKVETVIAATANVQATLARDKALSYFIKEFDAFFDIHPSGVVIDELLQAYKCLQKKALEKFDMIRAFVSQQIRAESHDELLKEFEKVFKSYEKENTFLVEKESLRIAHQEQEKKFQALEENLSKLSAQNERLTTKLEDQLEEANLKCFKLAIDHGKAHRELKSKIMEIENKSKEVDENHRDAQVRYQDELNELKLSLEKEKIVGVGNRKELELELQRVEMQYDEMELNKEKMLYELERLTSDALATHINVQCDGCRKKPIVGVRFKCNICYDYDLCEPCVARGTHSQHSFMKILDSSSSDSKSEYGCKALITETCDDGIFWVSDELGKFPDGALISGWDAGAALYVARASHENDSIPGKLLPKHGVAYVPWDGKEFGKTKYEVLVAQPDAVSWVAARGNSVPANAIPGGKSADGETLFIGRVNHLHTKTNGKFHPSHGTCYISYDGKELKFSEFEVLVKNGLTSDALATHINVQCDGCRKKPIVGVRFKCNICYDYDLCEPCVARGTHSQHSFMKILDSSSSDSKSEYGCKALITETCDDGIFWVSDELGKFPDGALISGWDAGAALYVARASHENDSIPGKLLPKHGVAYVPWGGKEFGKTKYEVLVAQPDAVSWVAARGNSVPANAIPGGKSADGETLFIGRVNHLHTKTNGKFHPSHGTCYISYDGKELKFSEFEVLVKNGLTSDAPATHFIVQCDGCRKRPIVGLRFKCNICYDYDLCEPCVAHGIHSQHLFMKILDSKYSYADEIFWVSDEFGKFPDGALISGWDSGAALYVARASHENDSIPGKLLPKHGVAYVPWGGKEFGKTKYEVLVAPPDAVAWVAARGNSVPANAIPGGKSADGETLFIGRVNHLDTMTNGKFHPSHGTCYISYDGKELKFSEFEVLVKR